MTLIECGCIKQLLYFNLFQEVIQCLKSKDAEEILSKENKVVNQPGLSFRPFVPTVDGDILNLEPKQLPYFLKKNSLE